jgi:hypothetical protein
MQNFLSSAAGSTSGICRSYVRTCNFMTMAFFEKFTSKIISYSLHYLLVMCFKWPITSLYENKIKTHHKANTEEQKEEQKMQILQNAVFPTLSRSGAASKY